MGFSAQSMCISVCVGVCVGVCVCVRVWGVIIQVLRSQDKSDRKNNKEGSQLFVVLICVIDSAKTTRWGWRTCFVCTEQREFSWFKVVFLQGQQLMDLEHKLTIAKEELEKTALDKVSKHNQWSMIFIWFSCCNCVPLATFLYLWVVLL